VQPLDGRDSARVFDEHRGLLNSVAYRILGSVTDAEDTVQEAWLRWSGVNPSDVIDSRAFLVRVTTRLAIDRLRRAKARRESYVGPWLPEPILTGRDVAEDVAPEAGRSPRNHDAVTLVTQRKNIPLLPHVTHARGCFV